jgi:hypothetical protein
MNSKIVLDMVIGALRDAYAAECEDLTEDEGAVLRTFAVADLLKYERLMEDLDD